MMAGVIIGLALGWLIAGAIVMAIAWRGDGWERPVGLVDVAVAALGVVLWPYLLFPEEGGLEDGHG